MSRAERRRLPLAQALVLGTLHGPAELLPISSSAHIEALPWLLGWSYGDLDEELRKSFEVVLHAGTAAGLAIGARQEIAAAIHATNRQRLAVLALAVAPPAVAGLLLERTIERRLGTPATIAGGLIGGSALMGLASRSGGSRRCEEATALDGLCLGLAQAAALLPGLSRAGTTLAVGRLRGFRPADAERLARLVGLPVIGGAIALRAMRMAHAPPEGQGPASAMGAMAALLSTLACRRLVGRAGRSRSLWPYVAYRLALAAALLARLRRT